MLIRHEMNQPQAIQPTGAIESAEVFTALEVKKDLCRTATRQWNCSYCGGKIKKGEKYFKSRAGIDAKITSEKKCLKCVSVQP